jgi:hypothetical protein
MLGEWESYYLLVGSAAAALIGLLFIVATLTTGIERSSAERGNKYYMTPIVFHLAGVVVLSAMALAPTVTGEAFGGACAIASVVGFAYGAYVAIGIANISDPRPHWSDKYHYGAAPALAYFALAFVAYALLRDRAWGVNGAATVVVVLLLLAIRNAWDLVTYLAPKQGGRRDDGGDV